jgi:hypothetical protein
MNPSFLSSAGRLVSGLVVTPLHPSPGSIYSGSVNSTTTHTASPDVFVIYAFGSSQPRSFDRVDCPSLHVHFIPFPRTCRDLSSTHRRTQHDDSLSSEWWSLIIISYFHHSSMRHFVRYSHLHRSFLQNPEIREPQTGME